MNEGITEERKEHLWEKIRQFSTSEVSDKEADMIAKLLQSEPMLKALGRVFNYANALPNHYIQLDLCEPKDLSIAIRMQGQVQGFVDSIDLLLNLITLPEEEENGSDIPES